MSGVGRWGSAAAAAGLCHPRGLELAQRRQKFLAGKVGPYRIDFESWHANLRGLVDLMDFLTRKLHLTAAVVLSGDVHYGMTVDVRFTVGDATIHLAQLVSSGLKHSGTITKTIRGLLGRLNRRCPRTGRLGSPARTHARSRRRPTGHAAPGQYRRMGPGRRCSCPRAGAPARDHPAPRLPRNPHLHPASGLIIIAAGRGEQRRPLSPSTGIRSPTCC